MPRSLVSLLRIVVVLVLESTEVQTHMVAKSSFFLNAGSGAKKKAAFRLQIFLVDYSQSDGPCFRNMIGSALRCHLNLPVCFPALPQREIIVLSDRSDAFSNGCALGTKQEAKRLIFPRWAFS